MRTYLKRIFAAQTPDNKLLSVYAQYRDSRPVGYRVTLERKPQQDFLSKEAAMEYAAALKRGAAGHTPTLTRQQQWSAAAHKLLAAEHVEIKALEFGLLAALTRLKAERRGVSARHLMQYDKLAEWLYAAGLNETGGEDWCRKATAVIQTKAHAAATFAARLSKFTRCLEQIALYGVFKPWRPDLSLYPAIIKECRVQNRGKPGTKHYKALTWQQVQSAVDTAPSPDAATMLVLVLSMGFRRGEQDRLTPDCVIDGKLNRDWVATKVKTGRTPELPAVALICLALPRAPLVYEEQRRLRTTCATHLVLAGVNPLSVAERLGHASIQMVTKHYAKLSIGKQEYPVQQMRLNGEPVQGNSYDLFLLYCLCERAKREGWLDKVKAVFSPAASVSVPAVADF